MKLEYFIDFGIRSITNVVILLFRLKNYKKKKIFIYTDSRGFEITKMLNRKNPFSSYISYFIINYSCKVFVCPEKHTTIFDFLYVLKKEKVNYDYILAHVGVVDFSPRPISQISEILNLKKEKITSVFNEQIYNDISKFEGYDTLYEKENTSAIIPENQIENISVKLNEIKNLIWISCNPVDLNWNGNYSKKRPLNINMVNDKSKDLIKKLKSKNIINLTGWNINEIHEYTCDNIHFSKLGMSYLEKKVVCKLKEM